MLFRTLCLVLALAFYSNASALDLPENNTVSSIFESTEQHSEGPISFELFIENQEIKPGQPFTVAIKMYLADGWHSYWKNPGESGMPIQMNWTLPEGFTAKEIQWPRPHRFDLSGAISYGYEGEAIFLSEITPPKELTLEMTAPLELSLQWLACSDSMCLPGSLDLSLKLPSRTPQISFSSEKIFNKARSLIPQTNPTLIAKKHQDFIEIQWDKTTTFKQATFYPESKKLIDETVPATLNEFPEAISHQSIVLKKNASAEPCTTLAGVLLLQRDDMSEVCWEVNLPFENAEKNPLVGLADIHKAQATQQIATMQTSPDSLEGNLPLAFLFAFIGGLLLNLMPCVLPVISLKILSFVKMAGQSRKATFHHGLAFFGGVIASFWVLAGAMLLLQSYGHAIGWGFQLQEPFFVGLLSALLLFFALNFFGVFELGTSLTSLAGQAQQTSTNGKSALFGSFCSGILATAVATPCSGPFLGSAIGFAFTLPPVLALAIFTVLGTGMALPYLLLSAFPSLLRFLPKPGAWMVTFKEAMGFVMLATVLWLLWVFNAQTGNLSLFILLLSLLAISFAAWIYGRFCSVICGKSSQTFGTIVSLALCGVSLYAIHIASSPSLTELDTSSAGVIVSAESEWEPFSLTRVEELKKQGTPVLIDFTAKWCLICQVNHLVLSSDEVKQKMREKNVVKMKADWTRKDATITEALQAFGRNAVPLYVLTNRGVAETPHILPQVLTPEIVIDFLNQLQ